jgi:hypothetical protein
VDVLNEGLDVPEVNTVLFLRPTESLTIFLQQLGRGLRRAPDKDALTVLDFVGQAHRRYRIDRKLKALLPRHRYGIDKEVELDFPHLPAGCSIQLDPVARGYVLANIRANLQNLAVQIPERIQTFESESQQPLTFGNFVRYHDYEPEVLLKQVSWSGWKARSGMQPAPTDPDLVPLRSALVRAVAWTSAPRSDRPLSSRPGRPASACSTRPGSRPMPCSSPSRRRSGNSRAGIHDPALRPGREAAQRHDGALHISRPRRSPTA